MNFEELLEKCQKLLLENNNLKRENEKLKIQLGIEEYQNTFHEIFENEFQLNIFEKESIEQTLHSGINNTSDLVEKIKLFKSLFKGRDDVHAKRWQNIKKDIRHTV